jgi:hypothetical protein
MGASTTVDYYTSFNLPVINISTTNRDKVYSQLGSRNSKQRTNELWNNSQGKVFNDVGNSDKLNLQDIIGDLTRMSLKTQKRINRDRKSLWNTNASRKSVARSQMDQNFVLPAAS